MPFRIVLWFSLVLFTILPLYRQATTEFDSDLWWRAAVGREIIQSGDFPREDRFSSTAKGQPWIDYAWASNLLLALVYRLGGLQAWTVLRILLLGAFLILILELCRIRTGNLQASFFATLLVAPLLSVSPWLRPQTIGLVLLALCLILIEKYRSGAYRDLWLLPPLMLLWVNLHGSFVMGLFALGWLGIALRSEPARRRHIAWVLLGCVAVLPLTPYGTRIAAYPLEMATLQSYSTSLFEEWLPFEYDGLMGILFLALAALSAIPLARGNRTFDWGLWAVGVVGTLQSRRFAVIFLVFVAPLLASLIARWVADYRTEAERPLVNAFLASGLLILALALIPSRELSERTVASHYPVGAIAFLKGKGAAGTIFNENAWGGYLIWEGFAPFIDGRGDLYDYSGVLRDYIAIMELNRPEFLLQKYGVDGCLLMPHTPLAQYLLQNGWQLRYRDETSVFLSVEANGKGAV